MGEGGWEVVNTHVFQEYVEGGEGGRKVVNTLVKPCFC